MEPNIVTICPKSYFFLTILVTLLFFSNTFTALACNTTTTTTLNSTQTYRTYIEDKCNTTTYPSICYKTLSRYSSTIQTDPFKLCNISVCLALKATSSISSTISKIVKGNNLTSTEARVIQDCIDNVKDSIDNLLQSLDTLSHLEGEDKVFQMDTIKTWMSAAITNGNTCTDGFDDQVVRATVRDKIRKSILNATMMTSNALFFINSLSY